MAKRKRYKAFFSLPASILDLSLSTSGETSTLDSAKGETEIPILF